MIRSAAAINVGETVQRKGKIEGNIGVRKNGDRTLPATSCIPENEMWYLEA